MANGKAIESVIKRAHAIARSLDDAERAALETIRSTPARIVREIATAWVAEAVRARVRVDVLEKERAARRAEQEKLDAENDAWLKSPEGQKFHYPRAHPNWSERAEKAAAERAEADAKRFQEARRRLMDEYETALKKEFRTEWEAELLACEFALPDGTVTTWGEASLEQHEIRREMFKKNAAANMEGAARHAQAVEALQSSGAPNLFAMLRVSEQAA